MKMYVGERHRERSVAIHTLRLSRLLRRKLLAMTTHSLTLTPTHKQQFTFW